MKTIFEVLTPMLRTIEKFDLGAPANPEDLCKMFNEYPIEDIQTFHDWTLGAMARMTLNANIEMAEVALFLHDVVCSYLTERKEHSAAVN